MTDTTKDTAFNGLSDDMDVIGSSPESLQTKVSHFLISQCNRHFELHYHKLFEYP